MKKKKPKKRSVLTQLEPLIRKCREQTTVTYEILIRQIKEEKENAGKPIDGKLTGT